MSFRLAAKAALVMCVVSASARVTDADVLASWELTGVSGYGASPLAPTTSAADLTIVGLTRGAGVAVTGTAAANAWGASGWDGNADLASAASTGHFASFTFTPTAGHTVSFSSIDPYNIRRSGSGPQTGQWQYSLDGANFTNIGSAITWGSTTTNAGNNQTAIDLSAISQLQEVAPETTVTFRVVNWNTGTGSAGTWYFNNPPTSTGSDLVINGTVGIGGSTSVQYFDGNGNSAGVGINGGSATWDSTSTNFTTAADGTGEPAVFDASKVAVFGGNAGSVTVDAVAPASGIRFESDGYVLDGSTITMTSVPTINVLNAGETATINSQISGSAGLSKTGPGTLVLTNSSNNFSGNVAISGGILQISSDGNLGSSSNPLAVSGGTLRTTASLTTDRTITGGGTFDIASGTTLTANGLVQTSGIVFSNSGTLDVNGIGTVVGNVTFNAPGTLTSSGGQLLGVSGITATNLTGVATVSTVGGISMGSGSKTIDVGVDGTVVVDASVILGGTGTNSLRKTGAGTLELTSANPDLWRIQLGSSSATTPTPGGVLKIGNSQSLGTNQLFLNAGTLHATTDLSGGNAIAIGVSLGGLSNAPAVLAGSPMEFQGAISFFETSGNQSHLTVNNTTTFSGTFSSGSGSGTGFTLDGSGKLIIAGDASAFATATTVAGSVTLAVNTGQWAAPITLNGGTLAGTGVVGAVVTAGNAAHTIAPSAALAAGSTANLTLSSLTTNANTTLLLHLGAAETASTASVNDQITVSTADGLTLDGASLTFTSNGGASSLGYYKIIRYEGAIQGAGASSLVLPLPQDSIVYSLDASSDPNFIEVHRGFLGDANDDGTVTFSDFVALANSFGQPASDWSDGDFNNDQSVTFSDFVILANNFGQSITGATFAATPDQLAVMNAFAVSSVPEPGTFAMLGAGVAILLKRRKSIH
jgi:autotransporter-associated beta strand protein